MMDARPQRIQLRRTKGWRLQEASIALNGLPAVKVDRSKGSMWGNWAAWRAGTLIGTLAVQAFRRWFDEEASEAFKGRAAIDLRGRNLACWCRLCERHKNGKPLTEHCPDCAPCHADVYGEMLYGPLLSNIDAVPKKEG